MDVIYGPSNLHFESCLVGGLKLHHLCDYVFPRPNHFRINQSIWISLTKFLVPKFKKIKILLNKKKLKRKQNF